MVGEGAGFAGEFARALVEDLGGVGVVVDHGEVVVVEGAEAPQVGED